MMDVSVNGTPTFEVSVKSKKSYLLDFRAKDNKSGSENRMFDGESVSSFSLTLPLGITTTQVNALTLTTAQIYLDFTAATVGKTYLISGVMTTDSVPPNIDNYQIEFTITN